jgi:PAS domain S-box-containing protein
MTPQKSDLFLRVLMLSAIGFASGMMLFASWRMLTFLAGAREPQNDTAVVRTVLDIGRTLADDIARVTDPAIRRGRLLATSHDIVEAIEAAEPSALIELCNREIQDSTEVDAVALFDEEGHILALNSVYSDGRPISTDRIARVMHSDFSKREVIASCLNNNSRDDVVEFQTACDITPALFDSSGLSFAHSVPIYNKSGRQVGLVSTRLRFERVSSLIADRKIANGVGTAYFVTDDGAFFDEALNSGAPLPLPKQELAAIVAPLVSGNAKQIIVEREQSLHVIHRVANMRTLAGGGIQSMLVFPRSWAIREARLQELLVDGGMFLISLLLFGVACVIGSLQSVRKAKQLSQRLAVIAELTSSAVVCCDADRKIFWVNDGFVQLTGFSSSEIQGQPIVNLLTCDLSEAKKAEWLRAMIEEGQAFQTEIVNRRKDLREYWGHAEFQPIDSEDGRPREYVLIVQDITEQMAEKQRLQSVFTTVTEGIVLQNVSGEIVECNLAAERILGLTTDQLRGRTSMDPRWQAIHEDGSPLPGNEHPAMVTLRTGRPQRNFVFGIHTPEQAIRWISVNTEPIFDPSGKIASVVASFADITQMREQAERLNVIIDASKLGTWDWDILSGYLKINPQWAQMLGYELNEIVPHVTSWEKILEPDSRSRVWNTVQRHLIGETEEYRNELLLRRKDGSYMWVLAAGKVISRLADGRPNRMVGIHIDIDEFKRNESQLRELTERYAAATTGTSDGLWDWQCGTEHCWYSDRYWSLLGFPEGGSLPAPTMQSTIERLHDDDREEFLGAIRRHLEMREDFNQEYRLRHENGEYRWFRGRAATQRDDFGQPIRMAGSIQDTHALKLTETSLIEANWRAEAANSAKTEFLANMSHEIRTPMTAILGFADLLMHDITNEIAQPSSLEYVNAISRNGEHLLTIINDILDISKIEAGKMTLESMATDPQLLIKEVVSLMNVKAQAKGIQLAVVTESQIPPVIQTDPVRLRQVLVNLVGNAIKFTELGSVTLRLRCDFKAELLQVAIEDTGIGLSPEQISRLFVAFEQADSTTTRNYGGTGLGLNISSRLAKKLGGDIHVESRLGQGSTFTATVATGPVSPDSINQHQPPQEANYSKQPSSHGNSSELSQLAGKRILFAEDGPDNQRLIAHVLRKAGAIVEIAENGKRAIEMLTVDGTLEGQLLDPCPFDLLLSDMQMPVMDGYSTVRWLRAHGSRMPVVALTAHAMSQDLQLCLDAGCDAYATKPIQKDALYATCAQWSSRKHSNNSTFQFESS